MIVSIVCHLEFSQAQPRGDFLANNITRLFGRRLSLRPTRLAAVFIRTSYTILNFLAVKARKSLVFACENSLHFKLAKRKTRCFHCISGLFRPYLVKIGSKLSQ